MNLNLIPVRTIKVFPAAYEGAGTVSLGPVFTCVSFLTYYSHGGLDALQGDRHSWRLRKLKSHEQVKSFGCLLSEHKVNSFLFCFFKFLFCVCLLSKLLSEGFAIRLEPFKQPN